MEVFTVLHVLYIDDILQISKLKSLKVRIMFCLFDLSRYFLSRIFVGPILLSYL